MSASTWAVFGACALGIAGGWNAIGLKSQVDPPHAVAGLDAADSNASASLLGQFRTNTSSWLWLRTDLYLHNGVELRPLTKAELQQGRTGVGTAEQDLSKALNEDNVVTSIPSADRDFRGWLGDLERATAPYRDMHNHTHNNPNQALPLFRLMTWIDPNFVEGWAVGATVIARDRTENGTAKALAFLNEGLKANPDSIPILNDVAFLYITRRRDLDRAVAYLEEARESGLRRKSSLSPEDLDEYAQTYRWLALCYRDLSQFEKMNEALREGQSVFPDDAVLVALADQPPSLLTDEGKVLWEKRRADKAREQVTQTSAGAHDLR